MARASWATVGAAKNTRMGSFTLKARRSVERSDAATSDCPPRSKKLSVTPIRRTPRASCRDPGDRFLDFVARQDQLLPVISRVGGGGQSPPIDLSVRGQRQGIQENIGRRQHVGRKQLAQPAVHFVALACVCGSGGHHIGNQPRISQPSSRIVATAFLTEGIIRSANSISPSSTRKPQILICWSRRPRNSKSAEFRLTRSPVR